MSTESGKTCGCKVIEVPTGRMIKEMEWVDMGNNCGGMFPSGATYPATKDKIEYCPLHDGSMAEKLAEALREARKYIHINSQYWEHSGIESATLLRAYDELQGRKPHD